MNISVAMTTYNGSKYIEKQLDSLRLQSMKVDEVIIADDCSTDNTLIILKDYITKWQLQNWFVFSNETNRGWIINFHNSISKTSGDYVFFCDQDDVWSSNKVSSMVNCLIENEKIYVLACKATFINSEGKHISASQETLPFGKDLKSHILLNRITNKFIYSIMPGCTMVVRRELITNLSTLKESAVIPHDALYWKIGTLLGKAFILNEELIDYRLHSNNASNPSAQAKYIVKTAEQRAGEIKTAREQLVNIKCVWKSLIESRVDAVGITLLDDLISFCDDRLAFVCKTRNGLTLGYLVHNYKYYRNLKMLINDCLIAYRNKKKWLRYSK